MNLPTHHRIPVDCKHITHRRWFKIKRSALRLKRSIGRLLHLIAKEPLTDAGILWVSYFAGDPCIRRLLAWLLRDDIVVDTVSTWTLDALVSAGLVTSVGGRTAVTSAGRSQAGVFLGAGFGPIFLGWTIENTSFATSWPLVTKWVAVIQGPWFTHQSTSLKMVSRGSSLRPIIFTT